MTCIAAVRWFLVDRDVVHRHVMCVVIRTHLDTRFFPVGGGDRYVVHGHVMFVVIRAYLDTRFFPVGGGGREARRHAGGPATKHAPASMSLKFYLTLVPDTA